MGSVTPDWLAQLAPAHAPPPAGWWPLAPGWWVLLMLLVARRSWLTRRSGLLLVGVYVAYIVLKIVTVPAA